MVNFRRDIRVECGFCQAHVAGSKRAEDVSIGICGPCRRRILEPLGLDLTVMLPPPATRNSLSPSPAASDREAS